jgi:CRP-like cAMP-binding protein
MKQGLGPPGLRPGNELLASLDACEAARLAPSLQPVRLRSGDVLGSPGRPVDAVVFPTSGIVSLSYVMESGASTAVALAGRESVVGIQVFMSGASSPMRSEVIAAGEGLRLPAEIVERERALGSRLQGLALRYIQALTTQMAQTAVCNRHHAVQQQLSRWLLLAFERADGNLLRLTQEQIAALMGVRREGVTEAAGRLQAEGVIRYARGLIELVDGPGLQRRACECYGVVRREYERLLPPREAS